MFWLKTVHRQLHSLAPIIPQLQEMDDPAENAARNRAVKGEVVAALAASGDGLDDVLSRMNEIYGRGDFEGEEGMARAKEWHDAFLSFLLLLPPMDRLSWMTFGRIMDGKMLLDPMIGAPLGPLDVVSAERARRMDAALDSLCGLMDDLNTEVGAVGLALAGGSAQALANQFTPLIGFYVNMETGRRSTRWPHRERLLQISGILIVWLGDPTAERIQVLVESTARMLDALQAELDQLPPA